MIVLPLANAIASLALGFAAIGDPDNPATPIVWPSPNVTIMIGADGSDDVAGNSDLTAIRSALAAWSAPACTNLRLIDGGLDQNPQDADDGVHTIFFRENNWPGGLSGAAAVTIHHEQGGGPQTWGDADIMLNGQDLEWSTNGDVQRFDIQSIITHELGHLIGLKHAASPEATMYFVSPRGTTQHRTLASSDVKAVCWLYPASGMRSCTTDEDCPLMISTSGANVRLTCTTGQCVQGAVSYGNECLGDGDCASGSCRRDPDTGVGDDPGFCTQDCSSAACPNGDFCQGNICFVGRDDCVADGDCNMNNVVCAIDLDGRRRCTHLCIADRNCMGNEICHGGTGANPPGFCRVPGAGAEGSDCENGYECSSLYCAGDGVQPTCVGAVAPPVDAGVPIEDATPGMDAPAPGADATTGRDRVITPPDDAGTSIAPDADDAVDAGKFDTSEVQGSCSCSSVAHRAAEERGKRKGIFFLFPLSLALLIRRQARAR